MSEGGQLLLGYRIRVARTFKERAIGLIGKKLEKHEGLLIEKCRAIHTCFMGYPIDVRFLDEENRLVKTVKNVRPWRLFVWGGRRAVKVLETKAED